jgi:phage baseplate assembly protein V
VPAVQPRRPAKAPWPCWACTARPCRPSHAANIHQVTWPDGTVVTYDHTAHALVATLAAGGHATLNADHVTVHCQTADVHAEQTLQLEVGDTLTVNAPETSWTGHIALSGTLDGDQDVTASGISLHGHLHGKVLTRQRKDGDPE